MLTIAGDNRLAAFKWAGALPQLLPRLRPQQRHPPWPDTGVEDRPRHQPLGSDASATRARAPHAAQHLAHFAVPAVEARKLRDGKAALAVAPRCEAIDREVEAGQLTQWAGED